MITAALLALGAPNFRPYRHPITAWVPPYAVAISLGRLRSDFGGAGMANALTHLSLQFWVPTVEGRLARANFPEITDANVSALRDWAHAHRIRAMLCVFNGEKTWDWPLARAAFAVHPAVFVESLLKEVQHEGLDGVDVDLEGIGAFEADRPAFVGFVRRLSGALRQRHKAIAVASFSAGWNAPNQAWWPDLFPLVDGLSSMGYEASGRKVPGTLGYAAQKRAAGRDMGKLQLGLPGYKDAWSGDTALDQLRWIQKDGGLGVGVWDAQLSAATWRTADVWKALAKIRG